MKLKCDKTSETVREMTDSEKAESIIKLINDYDINSTFLFGWQIEFIKKLCRKQLNNGWIPVSERLPELKEWCWVWFDYLNKDSKPSGNGYCDKMYLNSNGKWMKNTLSAVKDEYMDCIIAWQPYYEPEPYKE